MLAILANALEQNDLRTSPNEKKWPESNNKYNPYENNVDYLLWSGIKRYSSLSQMAFRSAPSVSFS